MNVLEVDNICKRLSGRPIIRGVSFSVQEGEIFGFLGPNGAGKTTTIRMLVGLIHPNEGNISIMGHNLSSEREKALSYVGAVVENPDLYSYLTGMENLMQIARIRNIPRSKVEEIVELVQLKNRINDKVKRYSLGMKQRLGLAAALLPDPKLLILDEPTNGLDPSGILDFRNIVKTIAKEKKTSIFISSHVLSEVQQLCHKVAFINKGIIQSVENVHENEVMSLKEILVISTKENRKCQSVLNGLDFVNEVKEENNSLIAVIKKDTTSHLIKTLVNNGVHIEEIYKKHKELEQRYMELMMERRSFL